MTIRTTLKRAGRLSEQSCSRCTLRDFDDDHDMMEIKEADVFKSETPTNFERWQGAGMSVHPMPQEQDQQQQPQDQQQQQNGGGGGDGYEGDKSPWNDNQPKKPSSEGIMLYLNGSRSHPVCVAIDDRRVRPYQTKPGEALYYSADGSGQTMYHRVRGDGKDGLYLLTCDDSQQSGHGIRGRAGSGQGAQKRYVSVRHVNKKKQKRKSKKLQDQAQQQYDLELFADDQQDYKHEGDSVNTETRHDAQQISYYDGSTNVGHYDRGGKDWMHHDGSGAEHSTRADKSHTHIKHEAHVWVSGACFKSMPFVIKPDPCK